MQGRSKALFVGSGVSAYLGMPNWKQVIIDIARQQLAEDSAAIVGRVLDSGGEYRAVDLLQTLLGSEAKLVALVEGIIRLRQSKISRERLASIRAVFATHQWSAIITTNWDTLISQCGFDLLCWPDNPLQEDAHLKAVKLRLAAGPPFVWHLHGAVERSRLIVSSEQCKSRAESLSRHRDYLVGILQDLYVAGCGFSDHHIRELLEDCARRGGSQLYALFPLEGRREASMLDTLSTGMHIQFTELEGFRGGISEFLASSDPTWELTNIASVKSVDNLLSVMNGSAWRFGLSSVMKDFYGDDRKLTSLSAEAAIEAFRIGDYELAGIFCTVLSTTVGEWDPTDVVFGELQRIVARTLSSGSLNELMPVEPLAFAIGRKGDVEAATCLHRLLHAEPMAREYEYQRYADYYQDASKRCAGYIRHLKDRPGQGVFAAWDLPMLAAELENAPYSKLPGLLDAFARSVRELRKDDDILARQATKRALEIVRTRRPEELRRK